jgi:hypothetical protein
MATVTIGMNGDERSVVLITNHSCSEITEHLTPLASKKLAVQLLSAAGRAERSAAASEWP